MNSEQKPSQSFFSSNVNIGTETKNKSEEFISKGANRKLEEPYDISFTIGSKFFANLITFVNEMNYDVVLWFKKKEMKLLVIDLSKTHAASIRFDKIEFADYNIKELENDDSEKLIYIDSSIINDELNINENYPIDFYVDTKVKNRFYIICGKEIVYKQLNTYKQDMIESYKMFDASVNKFVNDSDYQKITIAQIATSNLLSSLSKKVAKEKNKSTVVSLYLKKGEIDFVIKDEVKGSSIILNGEDVMISPLNDDNITFELGYLTKLNKLKLSFNCSLYINKNLPIIFESKFGGNQIILHYMIAPRTESSEEKRK